MVERMTEAGASTRPVYGRVLLKLSGDAFAPADTGYGINTEATSLLARQLGDVVDLGIQTAVVVGAATSGEAGRRRDRPQPSRLHGDARHHHERPRPARRVGKIHVTTRVQTAIQMTQVAEPTSAARARHLEKGRVVIFAAGLGVPFFSTDTTAAQRALEIHAEALLKGTKVDGVYTADPHVDPTASRFDHIEYVEVLREGYQVMDATAISLCMENKLPIVVFDYREEGNIRRVVTGDPIGTRVHGGAA
jgi:uridylate kinase